jgi:hypothetical protein
MSTSLTDRLRELLKPTDHPPVRTFRMGVALESGNMWVGTVVPEVDFRILENHIEESAPLLEAMVKLSGAVDEMCARYDDAALRDKDASLLSRGMTIGVRHVFDKALNELEQVLTKLEGK